VISGAGRDAGHSIAGRAGGHTQTMPSWLPVPRKGNDVYTMIKYGDGAFSESMRHRAAKRHVCVSPATIPICDKPRYQRIKISEMPRVERSPRHGPHPTLGRVASTSMTRSTPTRTSLHGHFVIRGIT